MAQLPLSERERLRYSRHLLLPEVGVTGQSALKSSRVLVVGAGGLGSPVILYLAAAGVGHLGVVDFDKVDFSNLQRQILYTDADVGGNKVLLASKRAESLNPEIELIAHDMRLSAENAMDLISQYDLVIDGTDNFSTRYLVNDACVLQKKPNVYGSIYRFEGQASVFAHDGGPCYRCLFPDPPAPDAVPNCAEAGVLGAIAGVIGCIQAAEALKIIIGAGTTLSGTLLLYDALNASFDRLPLPRNDKCPLCGVNPTITRLQDTSIACEVNADDVVSVQPTQLKEELNSKQRPFLLDVRTPQEVSISSIPGSVNIPLQELEQRFSELNRDQDIVVYCKSGGRSRRAIASLSQKGFKRLRNLEGGMDAW